mmetsp:Transcript_1734/g.6793  ORF Transcript_1734/g.6793 Transcript_1734/m.6793 type:complete len:361 (-) Transcript_1734:16-1098(-)
MATARWKLVDGVVLCVAPLAEVLRDVEVDGVPRQLALLPHPEELRVLDAVDAAERHHGVASPRVGLRQLVSLNLDVPRQQRNLGRKVDVLVIGPHVEGGDVLELEGRRECDRPHVGIKALDEDTLVLEVHGRRPHEAHAADVLVRGLCGGDHKLLARPEVHVFLHHDDRVSGLHRLRQPRPHLEPRSSVDVQFADAPRLLGAVTVLTDGELGVRHRQALRTDDGQPHGLVLVAVERDGCPVHEGLLLCAELESAALDPNVRRMNLQVLRVVEDNLTFNGHNKQFRSVHVDQQGLSRRHTDIVAICRRLLIRPRVQLGPAVEVSVAQTRCHLCQTNALNVNHDRSWADALISWARGAFQLC